MRTATRSALSAALLAGALLVPAASATAAGSGSAPSKAPASPAVSAAARGAASAVGTEPLTESRYLGQAVAIGNGIVAVLRNNDKSGPEAWLRYVGPNWTPADTYMVRVEGLLDTRTPAQRLRGLKTALVKLDSARPELKVTKDGSTKVATYKLPVRNSDHGRGCVSQVTRTSIGAGAFADLTTSTKGPRAVIREWAEPTGTVAVIDRDHSPVAYARILKADSAKPVFEWRTQPGTPGRLAFPKLPQGCTATPR
ncbi:hypothetical protein [Streptomyces sp. NPDC097619]|uniref:hypothetical protein n=1 Tax=Streptomyces sp. NPDC097619 TaxID=3157228 RepID=UPI0033183EAE